MAIVFLEVGQDVHLRAVLWRINEGVRQGSYVEDISRKSVVKDPLIRENTKDNTPAVIHTSIVPGDQVKITVTPKGFGSENMSKIFMLKPADGIEGVKEAVFPLSGMQAPTPVPRWWSASASAVPLKKCAIMAKHALTRSGGVHSDIPYVKEMEEELLTKINKLGIGPGGLGGTTTAFAVNIETYPTPLPDFRWQSAFAAMNRHMTRVI